MRHRVVVRPRAQAELHEARDWYENCRPGLGDEFAVEVEATIDAISSRPRRYAKVHGEIRRAILSRFPYAVFFRALPDEIVVLGIVHGHRDPGAWHSRR